MLDNVIFNFFLSVSWYCFPLCQTHHLAVSLQGMPEMSRPGQIFIPQLSHLRRKAPENVPGWSFIGQSGVMCTSLHQSPQPASHWLNQVTCVLQNKGIPVGMDWEVERDSSLRKTWKAFSKVWGWGAGWAETPDVNFYFPSLYMAELVHFVPHTLERPSGSCIWLTSFKALPCCGPWASCGGFSPFRSGTYSSGLGHWGDYVPLVSVSSPGMVKWPRKSWWDEIRLLLKLEWKKSFFSKLTFYHENFFPAHP